MLPALVTDAIRRDTVFLPYHWARPVAANALTIDALDPISKIPEYKVCACKVEAADELEVVPPPPVAPGRDPWPDEVAPLDADPAADSTQGRGTADA